VSRAAEAGDDVSVGLGVFRWLGGMTNRAASLGRRASGAVTSTFVNAGGSLVLQVVAARSLGAAGYGTFVIFTNILVLTTAVHTGWTGDSLTVLDRFDPRVRGGLVQSQLLFVGAGFLLATGLTLVLGLGDLGTGLVFAAMVALWLTEETGRRLLMARLQFWQLVLNDSIYVVTCLGALAAIRWTAGSLSIASFITAMAVGAVVAVAAALVQLPRSELTWARPNRGGLAEVARFAGWRSAQTGLRPLAALVMRVLVSLLSTRSALGRIEAARLLIAPALTFLAGFSSFLLPLYSEDERERQGRRTLSVKAGMLALFSISLGYGAVAVVFSGPLSRLLTAGSFSVSRVAVAGWVVFAAAFALGLPPANALVARRRSREVFRMRVVDSLVGLGLVVAVLLLGSPTLVPWAFSVGALLGVWLVARLAR